MSNTRLGLFHTSDELAIWRVRAGIDPGTPMYKSAGDVSTNSPGDWDRILIRHGEFEANPSNGRWVAPATVAGCVEANSNTFGWPEGNLAEGGTAGAFSLKVMSAAFHNLVTGVTTNHADLKTQLLWVSSQTFTDWGDPSGIWCFDKIYDSAPAVGVASVMLRLLFAYDYMGRAAFSSGELDQLDRWFFDAADWWRRDLDVTLDDKYVNRATGNYTLTNPCDTPVVPYVGGPDIESYEKYYNNRRGGVFMFTCLAGIYLTEAGRNYTDGRFGTQADLVNYGLKYCEEFVRFSVFPQGLVGDFERRTDDGGSGGGWETGLAYAGASIGAVCVIADALARAGNTGAYTYNTALGGCNTAGTISDGGSRDGQNRDLLFAVQSYMKYFTDIYARYYPSTGSEERRIDGRVPRNNTGWSSAHDVNCCMSNLYWQDTFIKQAYTRTHANAFPYHASPEAGPPPWTGAQSVFPGVLFMFGQNEGVVDPYTLTSAAPAAPGNLIIRSQLRYRTWIPTR